MGRVAEAAAQQEIVAADPRRDIKSLLKSNWSRMSSVMPKHMSSDRLLSLAISTINKTPKLGDCTPESILSCFMQCSSLGLEPSDVDGLGRAYILPYGRTATFILGYRGMLELARRSGDIVSIYAKAVYERDSFKAWEDEEGQHFRYEKNDAGERNANTLKGVFMFAKFSNGGTHFEHMTKDEIEGIRSRSKAKDNGPWKTDYEAMSKKTVIRRAFPYLPVSIEAQQAVAADETDGGYSSQIVNMPVIEIEQDEVSCEPEAPAVVGETEELATSSARCKSCGNEVEGVTAGATLEDLNQFMCCEKPDNEWVK